MCRRQRLDRLIACAKHSLARQHEMEVGMEVRIARARCPRRPAPGICALSKSVARLRIVGADCSAAATSDRRVRARGPEGLSRLAASHSVSTTNSVMNQSSAYLFDLGSDHADARTRERMVTLRRREVAADALDSAAENVLFPVTQGFLTGVRWRTRASLQWHGYCAQRAGVQAPATCPRPIRRRTRRQPGPKRQSKRSDLRALSHLEVVRMNKLALRRCAHRHPRGGSLRRALVCGDAREQSDARRSHQAGRHRAVSAQCDLYEV